MYRLVTDAASVNSGNDNIGAEFGSVLLTWEIMQPHTAWEGLAKTLAMKSHSVSSRKSHGLRRHPFNLPVKEAACTSAAASSPFSI